MVRDLTPLRTLTYDDTGEVYLSLELEHLPDYVETGAPVMVEVDEHDENVMHLYPDALCQEEPILPYELQLFCPVEREGRRVPAKGWLGLRVHVRRSVGRGLGRRGGDGQSVGPAWRGWAARKWSRLIPMIPRSTLPGVTCSRRRRPGTSHGWVCHLCAPGTERLGGREHPLRHFESFGSRRILCPGGTSTGGSNGPAHRVWAVSRLVRTWQGLSVDEEAACVGSLHEDGGDPGRVPALPP